ncbi:MAG TPA: putative glycoside hydrolase, partial [Thermomicrobiales bacterium]|nr:putative glycoside hydrolase [Thermomicrobiales bacterium]
DVAIAAPGYEAATARIDGAHAASWSAPLRPNTLAGKLTDAASGAAVAGAKVSLVNDRGVWATGVSGADGSYRFENVPTDVRLVVESDAYGRVEQPLGQFTSLSLPLKATLVTGTVVDANGKPIAQARITAANGSASTVSGPDGAFRLEGGHDVGELLVAASGYEDARVKTPANRQVAATLQPRMIKAVYANLGVLATPDRLNELLHIADTTEINAIVVDVKQDTIYYDTQVPFFKDLDGVVAPVFEPKQLLDELHAHNLYVIARMVVFKDPIVAEQRPDLAVKDEVTGGSWRDDNGAAWVNAFDQELWRANADLGVELTKLGFDEVQYDYIRFPSDGNLKTSDFGHDYTEANRRAAIAGAVKVGADEIHAAGGTFSVDLFPIIALEGNDQGIGQTLQDLTPLADYVSLMIYPSHFVTGNIPVDGMPNDFPKETVDYTLKKTEELVPGTIRKMRPWLQDFTYPLDGYSAYGPDRVRAEIDAAEAHGVSGWMLWNAAGDFHVDALKPTS